LNYIVGEGLYLFNWFNFIFANPTEGDPKAAQVKKNGEWLYFTVELIIDPRNMEFFDQQEFLKLGGHRHLLSRRLEMYHF